MPSKPFWPPMTLRIYALPCHSSAANLAHLSTLLANINDTPRGQLPSTHLDYVPPHLFAVLPGQPQKGRRFHDTQARVVFKDAVQSILPHLSAAAAGPLAEECAGLAPMEMMERLRRRLASHGLESAWGSAPTDRAHWARAFFEYAGPAVAPTNKDVLLIAQRYFRGHGIVLEDVSGDFVRGESTPAPNFFFIFASPSHAARAIGLGAFDLRIASATWHVRLAHYPYAIHAINPFTMAIEAGSGALPLVRREVEAMLAEFNRFSKLPSKLVLCDTPIADGTWVRVAVDSFAACRHLLDKFSFGPTPCKLELVYDLNERRLKPPKPQPQLGNRKRHLDVDLDLNRPLPGLDVLVKLAAEQSRATAALVAHQSQTTAAFIATLAHIREHQSLSTAWVVYTATLSGLNGDLMRVEGNIERHEEEISNLHDRIAMYSAAGEMGEAWDAMIQNARDQLAHSEQGLRLAQGELATIKKRKEDVEGDKPAPRRPLVLPPVLVPRIEEVEG